MKIKRLQWNYRNNSRETDLGILVDEMWWTETPVGGFSVTVLDGITYEDGEPVVDRDIWAGGKIMKLQGVKSVKDGMNLCQQAFDDAITECLE